jgi:hypothetical protein
MIEGTWAARMLMEWWRMESMLITCPESAHLERIAYEDHPLGLLIAGCSRFRPTCAVTCGRTCAARLDQRGQREPAFEEDEEDTRLSMPAEAFLHWLGEDGATAGG